MDVDGSMNPKFCGRGGPARTQWRAVMPNVVGQHGVGDTVAETLAGFVKQVKLFGLLSTRWRNASCIGEHPSDGDRRSRNEKWKPVARKLQSAKQGMRIVGK